MKTFLCAVITLVVCTGTARSQCITPNDNATPQTSKKTGLYTGQQEFSLALLQAINHLNPDGNLFFSPYSTYHALLLAYFISSSETEAFLKKTLRLSADQNKADVFRAYKFDKFVTQTRSQNASYEFTNANRIYVDNDVKVRDCVPSLFIDELRTISFKANPEKSRAEINTWVEEQTRSMIKDLLPSGSIDQTTNLVLVNAAYFKGIWENQFDPAKTKEEVFYITPTKRTFVDMMHVEGAFNHDVSESLMAHILELPYQGGDISMFILLPPFLKDDGVATILKKLTLEKFQEIVENRLMLPRTVQVSVPKFSLEHTIEMVPILESLGVGNLFKSDADFSILTGNRDLSLGAGIHKAKVRVDETGATAAAATALFTFRMMNEDPPVQFNCTRPFVFILYNKHLHTVLFMGVYRNP